MDLLLRDEPVTLSLSLCRPLVVELILPPLQIFGQMSDQETLFFFPSFLLRCWSLCHSLLLSLSPFSVFVLFDSLKEGFRYMVGSLILLNTWVLTLPTVDMKSWSHWIHHQPIISPSSLHHHSHLFSIFTLLVASFFFSTFLGSP